MLRILFVSLDGGTKTIKASELAKLLKITPAGVTHLLNSLEEGGYLERLKDPDDRRVVLVGITDKGKRFAEGFIENGNEMLAGLIDHLGEEDSQAMIRLMSSVIEYLAVDRLDK
jgi:DNA-binding MarR family transcriptional regulator